MFANCEMQGAFSELSSFWISFATDDPSRLGSRNYPNLYILRRGLEPIHASKNSIELELLTLEIERTEQAHIQYLNPRLATSGSKKSAISFDDLPDFLKE